jgi:hypothetical protein
MQTIDNAPVVTGLYSINRSTTLKEPFLMIMAY